jgi:glycosyltransferase involved in cell wall biosynthesis
MSKRKKKILFKCSQTLGVDAHGAEAHTQISFVKMLAEEYEVHIVGPETFPEILRPYIIAPLFRYISYPRWCRIFLHVPASVLNTAVAVQKVKPNLISCVGGVYYNGMGVALAGRLFKIKTMVRTAEDHFKTAKLQPTQFRKVFHYFCVLPICRFVFSKVDKVLTVGESSKEYFINQGLKREKVLVAPNPVPIKKFGKSFLMPMKERKSKFQLPKDKKIALYIGGGQPFKGFDFLPEIIGKVIKRDASWHFWIIGATQNANSKVLRDLSCFDPEYLTLMGARPYEELDEIYQTSDVLLFLTQVGVGYGLVTVEAAIAGCPTLCLDPQMDVLDIHGDSPKTVDEFVERLLKMDYSKPNIERFLDYNYTKEQHLDAFRKAIQ